MVSSRWTVLAAAVTVAVVSLVGAGISVAQDLNEDLLAGLGPEARLSVPLPFLVVQLALGLAAAARNRVVALIGSGLALLAGLVSVVSGLFDGGYTDDQITGWLRGYQLVLVAALLLLAIAGAIRFMQVWRVRASADASPPQAPL